MPDNTTQVPNNPQLAYSDALEKLITNDKKDIEGLIAYSLYKIQKQEFAKKLNGIDQNQINQRLSNYHDDLTTSRIVSLRAEANDLVSEYATIITQSIATKDREQQKESYIATHVVSEIKKATQWWKSVIFGVIGSFAFAIILTVAGAVQWTNPLLPFISNNVKNDTNTQNVNQSAKPNP